MKFVGQQWLLGHALPGHLRVDPPQPVLYWSWGESGGPFEPLQWSLQLTNTGGSSLDYAASSNVDWVSLSPGGGSLAPGQEVWTLLSINGNAGILPPGVHDAIVDIVDSTNGGATSITARLSVSADLVVTPLNDYSATGPRGSLGVSPKEYRLSNAGSDTMSYRVTADREWLTLSSTGGTLPPGGTSAVTVSLSSVVNSLAPGTYSGSIAFEKPNGASRNVRPATLIVTPRSFTLTVVNTQLTLGRVISNPEGIDCGKDCAEGFVEGMQVELAAIPFAGGLFVGWSGDGCSGTDACRVAIDAAKTVIASFREDESAIGLSNAIPRQGVLTAAVRQAEWKFYYFDVPAGALRLNVALFDLAADLDLYVRYGAKPSLTAYACRPYYGGTVREDCFISAPSAGKWWIGVNNWSTGTIAFTVKASAARGLLDFYTVTPCRALDTRSGSSLMSGTVSHLSMSGICGVPLTARAVSVNVTASGASGEGYLTFFPGDGELPGTSTINFRPGTARANNAILLLAADDTGRLAVYSFVTGGGHVDVMLDVNGYFE